MVLIFSDRKSAEEKEIISILKGFDITYISDKFIKSGKKGLTILNIHKIVELNIDKGIAVMIGDTSRFSSQKFPKGIIGICDCYNKNSLEIFAKHPMEVITCGMGRKNTVTFSSINQDTALLTFQRNITDFSGRTIEPAEYRLKLKTKYNNFSVMASFTILLLNGIKPDIF